jgi:hypothetical protein
LNVCTFVKVVSTPKEFLTTIVNVRVPVSPDNAVIPWYCTPVLPSEVGVELEAVTPLEATPVTLKEEFANGEELS